MSDLEVTPLDVAPPVTETYEERAKRLYLLEQELEEQEKQLLMQEAAADSTKGLTFRQRRFVEEFLVDLNSTKTALRAGYATPDVTASKMLASAKIAQAVEAARSARENRVNMTRDRVLAEMAILAESCAEHYMVDDEGQLRAAPGAPEGAMRAVQSIRRRVTVKTDREGNQFKTYDVEFKLWDKPTPLRLMGKQVGLNFSDRVELTGADGGPVVSRVLREVIDPVIADTD